jgi:hypothetical protein
MRSVNSWRRIGVRDFAAGGDDKVWSDDSGDTAEPPAYDHAGNMIDDGTFVYPHGMFSRTSSYHSVSTQCQPTRKANGKPP